MKTRFLVFFLVLAVVGVSIASFYLSAKSQEAQVVPPPAALQEKLPKPTKLNAEMFDSILARIREDYVEPVTDEKLLTGALVGMLSALDPHSTYMEPKEFEELKIHTKGEFGGLGLEVIMENGLVKIVSPIDDTPADKAGLQSGDLVVGINKKPVNGMTLIEAVDLMRGKPGTKVLLHIKREGQDVFEKVLTRAVIQPKVVKWRVEGNVGYIRIATFSDEKTATLVKEAIEALKKQLGKKMGGIVIDVRNNPGGLFDTAIGVSDLFLLKGQKIVSVKGRNPKMDTTVHAEGKDILGGLPIVVLVNGGTASSSEIVAGALRDNHRAIVVGTKSFGKGSVQVVLPLTNGGALKLTIARYFTPSGTSIQAKGIEPDIFIDQAFAKLEALDEKNHRLYESDIKGALDSKKDSKENTEENFLEDLDPDNKKKGKEIKDYQLMRAIDIVRTMYLTQQYAVKEKSCQ